MSKIDVPDSNVSPTPDDELGAQFKGAPVGSILCIELCAGCARLSLALSTQGFKAMAVDQKSNRHRQLFPTVTLDLANEEAVQYLATLLRQPGLVFYLHCAPPCGTASRAREKKLSARLIRRGVKEPKPLRSGVHPHGLPGLAGVDLKRVTTANAIYKNIAALCELAMKSGAYVSIENPSRSYMWMTRWMAKLISDFNLVEVKFQQCMWSGRRDKWSSFYTNAEWLHHLARECDQSHHHAPWGVSFHGNKHSFNTAEEAEYPQKLCAEIASSAMQAALVLGCIAVPLQSKSSKRPLPKSGAAGRQPRGNNGPEIIPEFDYTLECRWSMPPPAKVPRLLSPQELDALEIPQQSKLLSFIPIGDNTDESYDNTTGAAKIGVFRNPDSFVEQAMQIKHPFDDSSGVEDQLKRNMFELLTLGCKAIAQRREETMKYYSLRKLELSDAEASIHEAMPPHRRKLVEGKAFLLFGEMCEAAGITDPDLRDLQVLGTSLLGRSGCSSLFESEDNDPAMTVDQVMKSSRWSRRMLLGRSSQSQNGEVEAQVWQGALEEVQRGWLQGPFTEGQVVERLGPLFVASPRFGLQQSDKVRSIDDMSISLVNSGFAAGYRLSLDGVDGISTLSRTFLEAVQDDRKVAVSLSDGTMLSGTLHETLSLDEARDLCGRTLDLEAAYKQMLVRESSLWSSVLLISEPGVGKQYFISQVLPFGASASVYAFNRVARAIYAIGVSVFSLLWTNYYDDYPQLDLMKSGSNAQDTAEALLDLLGWRYSQKESKRQPMGKSFAALGVVFDFELSKAKKVLVKNKGSRAEQVCQDIDRFFLEDSFTSAMASTLRGRLQFAESQTFSRAVALHMRSCHARATGADASGDINPSIRNELLWAKEFITESPPRVLRAGMSDDRVVIFTDASLDDEGAEAGVGMVMFQLKKGKVLKKFFFSERVPSDVLRKLQVHTPKVIAALELLAAIQALIVCEECVTESRTFLYVDNEAARANLIAMYSPVLVQANLLREMFCFCSRCSTFVWTARVPSLSNPADAPSRFQIQQLVSRGFTQLQPPWDLVR